MTDDRPTSGKDWRAQPPVNSRYSREWRRGNVESKKQFSRQFKLAAAGGCLLSVVGVIIYLLFTQRISGPETHIVTFGIAAYEAQGQIPINSFGQSDADSFPVLHEWDSTQFPSVERNNNELNSGSFLSFLEKQSQDSRLAGRRNLLVFCSLHARVDESGTVELYAVDASPDASSRMIPLTKVMSVLQQSRASRVLLVIDASRLEADWRMGILGNDVSGQIAALWPQKSSRTDDPRQNKVSIILAAGPGERSWVAGEQSALVKFIIEGLQGSADGWKRTAETVEDGGDKNHRVSLHELDAFVQSKVTNWVRQHAGVSQSTQLLGNTVDFDLAAEAISPRKTTPSTAGNGKAEEASASNEVEKTESKPKVNWNDRLAELWKYHDDIRDATDQSELVRVRRQSPLAWRSFQLRLKLAEDLRRGGLEELLPRAVEQTDEIYQRLARPATSQSDRLVEADDHRKSLRQMGILSGQAEDLKKLTSEAEKYLEAVASEKPGVITPDNSSDGKQLVTVAGIQSYLRQEMLREISTENWNKLALLLKRLVETNRLPITADCNFVYDVVTATKAAERMNDRGVLQRIFQVRDRCRRIALTVPESHPLIFEKVGTTLRALRATERWMLSTDITRPEVNVWLKKSEESLLETESHAQQYHEAVGIWSDLVCELPLVARWIASRAADEPRRKVDWRQLKKFSQDWVEQDRNGTWSDGLRGLLPDKPSRLADVERAAFDLFIDAQRLKSALMGKSHPGGSDVLQLISAAKSHRTEFRNQIRASLPRQGAGDPPTPTEWQDAVRLTAQPWLTSDERRQLDSVTKMEPKGDRLLPRSVDTSTLWQGFWAIASLSLMSHDSGETKELWRDWADLVDNSESTIHDDARAEVLRKQRSRLGKSVARLWTRIGTTQTNEDSTFLELFLTANSLDPALTPLKNPDDAIQKIQQKFFTNWLSLFADDWRQRDKKYQLLAERVDRIIKDIGTTVPSTKPDDPRRFKPYSLPTFDANRRGKLDFSTTTSDGFDSTLNVKVSGAGVRLIENASPIPLATGVKRPFDSKGQAVFDLELDRGDEIRRSLLAVLVGADDFPLEFREIPMNPPFDPSRWRIEFVDSVSNAPLVSRQLLGQPGVKVFLPPGEPVSIRAELVRPAKDATAHAMVTILKRTLAGSEILQADLKLDLEAGKERTAIKFDLPVKKDKEPPTAAPSVAAIAELAYGLEFRIVPEGQEPLTYQVRPTFWSAANFIVDPVPELANDRFSLPITRRPATAEETLIPAKVKCDLTLPSDLRSTITELNSEGTLRRDDSVNLFFTLPKNWNTDIQRTWDLALNVGGLPHAYRWRISPDGSLTQIAGQPPRIAVRLILPQENPKAPPRVNPVVRQGEEKLHLQFQIDAWELDRGDESGDWNLSYEVVRESEPPERILQGTHRLFSSLQRSVMLDAVEGGVWKIRTALTDIEFQSTENFSQLGAFVVRARLTRAAEPEVSVAEADLKFASDDDKPSAILVSGVSSEPHSVDKPLSFKIRASDPQSGILLVKVGFDSDNDGKIGDQERLIEDINYPALRERDVEIPMVIKPARLPIIEKDQESKNLLVVVENGRGVVSKNTTSISFLKSFKPKVTTTAPLVKGRLRVNLKDANKGKITISVEGTELDKREDAKPTEVFSLKPGRYKVSALIVHSSTGVRQRGEAMIDVVSDEQATVDITMSVPN